MILPEIIDGAEVRMIHLSQVDVGRIGFTFGSYFSSASDPCGITIEEEFDQYLGRIGILSQGRIGIFNRSGIKFFYDMMDELRQVILGDVFINGSGKQHDLIFPVRLEFRHLWTSLSV